VATVLSHPWTRTQNRAPKTQNPCAILSGHGNHALRRNAEDLDAAALAEPLEDVLKQMDLDPFIEWVDLQPVRRGERP